MFEAWMHGMVVTEIARQLALYWPCLFAPDVRLRVRCSCAQTWLPTSPSRRTALA